MNYKNLIKSLLLSICGMWLVVNPCQAQSNVDYVNMMIGSDGPQKSSYGGTWPGIGAPFAMTQWCAQTQQNALATTVYRACNNTISGFQATHQPAIWMADYGFITVMPQAGELRIDAKKRAVKLERKLEVATPYYYKVSYPGYSNGVSQATSNHAGKDLITTEMTATSRAAIFRISYPTQEKAFFMIEAGRELEGGGIEIIPSKNEIRVYNLQQMNAEMVLHAGISLVAPNFKGCYVLKFSKPFAEYGTWKDGKTAPGKCTDKGSHVGGYVTFAKGTKLVEVRAGSSFIDFDQAADNLNKEVPMKLSFDKVKYRVKAQWNEKLNSLHVEGATDEQKTILYTAFMRTLQFPREFSEYGRYYSAFDGKIHEGISYNDYSLWDTFRAEHPWLQLVAGERVDGMVQALVNMYEEGGWLPKWPNPNYSAIMIGSHADAVIADAYVNGFRGYDVQKAWEAVRKDAFVAPDDDMYHMWADRALWHGGYESRGGLTNYLKRGWVASDRTKEAVSRTLEFCLDDYCIAQMAKELGHTADYDTLMAHAQNYRHLYNPATSFFQARKEDGKWDTDEEGFTEGAKWTYQFCVMQDVKGMIDLMGGNEKFVKLLDANFDGGHYKHVNEPGHHYVYLYDYAGRHDLAQKRIPGILRDNYHTGVDGLSGNDDCGQMSAWYIFSAMGFYPVTPASGIYALGIPAFKSLMLNLSNGKTLKVIAEGLDEHDTLTHVTFNGKVLDEPFIKVKDIMNGGTLVFSHKK